MFDKIKNLLLEIEKTGIKDKEINKEKLKTILSTIKKIEDEISELKEKTEILLNEKKTKEEKAREEKQEPPEEKETAESSGFINKIQSSRVNITTLIDKGWNLIVSGKYKEAIKALSRAKKMDPENIKVYNLLGWAYIHLKEYDKSSMIFQEVLKMDPKNEMANANLGYINHKKGLYGEAIEKLSTIEKTAKNKQAVLYALFYLGLVYYEREMYEDSVEFLNKAINAGPNLYEAYYYLGKAYQKQGLNNLCIQIWEKLIKTNKYNIWAKKAEEELNGK
jgi:tetratricopeptide (TPR) repeat protein